MNINLRNKNLPVQFTREELEILIRILTVFLVTRPDDDFSRKLHIIRTKLIVSQDLL